MPRSTKSEWLEEAAMATVNHRFINTSGISMHVAEQVGSKGEYLAFRLVGKPQSAVTKPFDFLRQLAGLGIRTRIE